MSVADLTKTERRLFDCLRARAGEWVSRDELVRALYGFEPRRGDPRVAVRVHIVSIRKKLGDDRSRLESDAHRLRGYRWNPPTEPADVAMGASA